MLKVVKESGTRPAAVNLAKTAGPSASNATGDGVLIEFSQTLRREADRARTERALRVTAIGAPARGDALRARPHPPIGKFSAPGRSPGKSQPWLWARFGCPGAPKDCLRVKTHQRLLNAIEALIGGGARLDFAKLRSFWRTTKATPSEAVFKDIAAESRSDVAPPRREAMDDQWF
jgi:hypothetical protein